MWFLVGLMVLSFPTAAKNLNNSLRTENLRIEYLKDPVGIDSKQPRFSWTLSASGRNRAQSAYQILVSSSVDKLNLDQGDIWNSGKIPSNQTNQIVFKGAELESRKEYFWKVKVWDEANLSSNWSNPASWSMGFLNYSDWQGKWISHEISTNPYHKYEELYLPPTRFLRKEFEVTRKVRRATVYATALGVYELRMNGSKVGDYYLAPGWTDYQKRVYYNTFDVTDQIKPGKNAIGAEVADGWYSGYLGFALLIKHDQVRDFYGQNPSFMGQLEIEYEDGTLEIIATDNSWKSNQGPTREADILMGETYDGRMELTGWDQSGYNAQAWSEPKIYPMPNGMLQAYPGTPVKIRERIVSKRVSEPSPGTYIFDLGKNIAGIYQLKVQGERGTRLKLRFGEILHEDGSLMTENLRRARATDTYILKGGGIETWSPKFTYHGFQFVEITGLKEAPDLDMITGLALSSIETNAGTFKCSNDMNNKLFSNILTTQLANFIDVPTDCPQRDERLGWTGDAQIYCRSATYNSDVASFFKKYSYDLIDAQRWYGAYPNFAPFPYSRATQYSPAWMDAGVIIPYTMYKVYGDTRIIREMYPSMRKFMDFQANASTDYLRPAAGSNWGDWLNLNEPTSNDFVAAVYYGHDAQLMSEMAKALDDDKEAEKYADLFQNIKAAITDKYIKDNGFTTEDTQTSYALALCFNLYPEALAQLGADRLAEKIIENGNRFATGFLGTKYVMLALSRYGHANLAYKLFKQTEYPSWGYSVVNGSTSVWERWNSYTKDAKFNKEINVGMNSFSHYAFGSVTEWMYQFVLGIDSQDAGFRNLILRPIISKELQSAGGSYQSINGPIKSEWQINGSKLIMNISIPVNVKATVHLPATDIKQVYESDVPLDRKEEIKLIKQDSTSISIEVGSGEYSFTINI